MTATTSETSATEVAEAPAETPEPLTFEQLQKAIWLTARSQWGELESDQECVEKVYNWCSSGINEVLINLRLPAVHDDVAYFDAWQAWHNKWELDGNTPHEAYARSLRNRVRRYLENSSSVDTSVKNKWLVSWGLDELPKPTTRGTVQFHYELTDETDKIIDAIKTALEPWKATQVRWCRY